MSSPYEDDYEFDDNDTNASAATYTAPTAAARNSTEDYEDDAFNSVDAVTNSNSVEDAKQNYPTYDSQQYDNDNYYSDNAYNQYAEYDYDGASTAYRATDGASASANSPPAAQSYASDNNEIIFTDSQGGESTDYTEQEYAKNDSNSDSEWEEDVVANSLSMAASDFARLHQKTEEEHSIRQAAAAARGISPPKKKGPTKPPFNVSAVFQPGRNKGWPIAESPANGKKKLPQIALAPKNSRHIFAGTTIDFSPDHHSHPIAPGKSKSPSHETLAAIASPLQNPVLYHPHLSHSNSTPAIKHKHRSMALISRPDPTTRLEADPIALKDQLFAARKEVSAQAKQMTQLRTEVSKLKADARKKDKEFNYVLHKKIGEGCDTPAGGLALIKSERNLITGMITKIAALEEKINSLEEEKSTTQKEHAELQSRFITLQQTSFFHESEAKRLMDLLSKAKANRDLSKFLNSAPNRDFEAKEGAAEVEQTLIEFHQSENRQLLAQNKELQERIKHTRKAEAKFLSQEAEYARHLQDSRQLIQMTFAENEELRKELAAMRANMKHQQVDLKDKSQKLDRSMKDESKLVIQRNALQREVAALTTQLNSKKDEYLKLAGTYRMWGGKYAASHGLLLAQLPHMSAIEAAERERENESNNPPAAPITLSPSRRDEDGMFASSSMDPDEEQDYTIDDDDSPHVFKPAVSPVKAIVSPARSTPAKPTVAVAAASPVAVASTPVKSTTPARPASAAKKPTPAAQPVAKATNPPPMKEQVADDEDLYIDDADMTVDEQPLPAKPVVAPTTPAKPTPAPAATPTKPPPPTTPQPTSAKTTPAPVPNEPSAVQSNPPTATAVTVSQASPARPVSAAHRPVSAAHRPTSSKAAVAPAAAANATTTSTPSTTKNVTDNLSVDSLRVQVEAAPSRPTSARKPAAAEIVPPRTLAADAPTNQVSCDTCNNAAVCECADCESPFCDDCFVDLHRSTKLKKHQRMPLEKDNKVKTVADAQPTPKQAKETAATTVIAKSEADAGLESQIENALRAQIERKASVDRSKYDQDKAPITTQVALCGFCSSTLVSVACNECSPAVQACRDCDEDLHSSKSKRAHKREPIESAADDNEADYAAINAQRKLQEGKLRGSWKKEGAAVVLSAAATLLCEICESLTVVFRCSQCKEGKQNLCADCDATRHANKKYADHDRVAVIMGRARTKEVTIPQVPAKLHHSSGLSSMPSLLSGDHQHKQQSGTPEAKGKSSARPMSAKKPSPASEPSRNTVTPSSVVAAARSEEEAAAIKIQAVARGHAVRKKKHHSQLAPLGRASGASLALLSSQSSSIKTVDDHFAAHKLNKGKDQSPSPFKRPTSTAATNNSSSAPMMCDICDEVTASCHCLDGCGDMCADCAALIHKPANKRNHQLETFKKLDPITATQSQDVSRPKRTATRDADLEASAAPAPVADAVPARAPQAEAEVMSFEEEDNYEDDTDPSPIEEKHAEPAVVSRPTTSHRPVSAAPQAATSSKAASSKRDQIGGEESSSSEEDEYSSDDEAELQ